MAFAQADMSLIQGTVGADGHNVWSYVTDDDLFDSFTNQTEDTAYFLNAFGYNKVRDKDIIICSHNSATKPVVLIGATADWTVTAAACILCE